MSGGTNGVQALVKEIYPQAEYIHCYAHQLNLVMSKAASINRPVKVFFSTVQGLCVFFSNSPQRTRVLDAIVKKRLLRTVVTRWNYQSRSVSTSYQHREDLIQTMEFFYQLGQYAKWQYFCSSNWTPEDMKFIICFLVTTFPKNHVSDWYPFQPVTESHQHWNGSEKYGTLWKKNINTIRDGISINPEDEDSPLNPKG